MYRSQYYKSMKVLANSTRARYQIATARFGLAGMRAIYREEGITIDMRVLSGNRIRAAYFCDGDDPSVLLNRRLPKIPRLFALAHELKHHYCDRETIGAGKMQCGNYNAGEATEIGAEVFAAELIYPEAEFLQLAQSLGLDSTNCSVESIINFKRACPASISYKFLLKRLEWFNIITNGEYSRVQFQKREEEIHGLPIYKQPWFIKKRQRKQ